MTDLDLRILLAARNAASSVLNSLGGLMSETWYTVDASGHVPGIEAELPPGRVLLDDNTMQMIDHEWTVEETTPSQIETPPITEEAPTPQIEEQE